MADQDDCGRSAHNTVFASEWIDIPREAARWSGLTEQEIIASLSRGLRTRDFNGGKLYTRREWLQAYLHDRENSHTDAHTYAGGPTPRNTGKQREALENCLEAAMILGFITEDEKADLVSTFVYKHAFGTDDTNAVREIIEAAIAGGSMRLPVDRTARAGRHTVWAGGGPGYRPLHDYSGGIITQQHALFGDDDAKRARQLLRSIEKRVLILRRAVAGHYMDSDLATMWLMESKIDLASVNVEGALNLATIRKLKERLPLETRLSHVPQLVDYCKRCGCSDQQIRDSYESTARIAKLRWLESAVESLNDTTFWNLNSKDKAGVARITLEMRRQWLCDWMVSLNQFFDKR